MSRMRQGNGSGKRVVVITGASGGIGRAAALEFAGRGDCVVLAARRAEALDEVAKECERAGGEALAVPTDVTDETQVRRLADAAVAQFGHVDAWVNNASVTLFARFESASPSVFRRVIETNFFGYVHGARAAMRRFREQGHGVLVNVASMVAQTPQPFTSAYVASKFAIRGLSDAIRMELDLDGSRDLHVVTVLPPSVDTPLFQQGANFTGRKVKPMNPVLRPEKVARAIVRAVDRPGRRREVFVGLASKMALPTSFRPRSMEPAFARQVDRDHFRRGKASWSEGNLFEPMPEHATVRGGWRRRILRKRLLRAAAVAALAPPAVAFARGLRRGPA